jgi:hypothetical protein
VTCMLWWCLSACRCRVQRSYACGSGVCVGYMLPSACIRFNAAVSTGLNPGGCWLVGQRATVGDANCTKMDPMYSYEGYLREVSLWTVVLPHSRVGKVFLCTFALVSAV